MSGPGPSPSSPTLSDFDITDNPTNPDNNFAKVNQFSAAYSDILQSQMDNIQIVNYLPDPKTTYVKSSRVYAPFSNPSTQNQYAFTPDHPSLAMTKFNENLYTVANARLEATKQQYLFHSQFMSNDKALGFFSNKTTGLKYRIVKGSISIMDITFVYESKTLGDNEGVSKDLSSLASAIPKTIPDAPCTIELQGYFLPDVTGQWKFDKSGRAVVWIGDNALYTYDFDNFSIRPMESESSVALTAGVPYKIRIWVLGDNMLGMDGKIKPITFSLSVTDPNGNKTVGCSKYLHNCNIDKDMFYYALVEDTPANTQNGLFSLYHLHTRQIVKTEDYGEIPASRQLKEQNPFTMNAIWKLSAGTQSTLLNTGTQLKLSNNDGTPIVLKTYGSTDTTGYTSTASAINKLFNTITETKVNDDVSIKFENGNLTTMPDLYGKTVQITDNQIPKYMDGNNMFRKIYQDYYSKGIDLSILKPGESLLPFFHKNFNIEAKSSGTGLRYDLDQFIRLTADGKYILFVDMIGIAQICYTTIPKINSTGIRIEEGGEIKYTTKDSLTFVPYSIEITTKDADSATYLVNNKKQTYNKINPLELIELGHTFKYAAYQSVVPSTGKPTDSNVNSFETCKKVCDTDTDCKFYYAYKTSDSMSCQYGKFSDAYSYPSYGNVDSTGKITSSTLYEKTDEVINTPTKVDKNNFYTMDLKKNLKTSTQKNELALNGYTKDDMTFKSLFKELMDAHYKAKRLISHMGDPTAPWYDETSTTDKTVTEMRSNINKIEIPAILEELLGKIAYYEKIIADYISTYKPEPFQGIEGFEVKTGDGQSLDKVTGVPGNFSDIDTKISQIQGVIPEYSKKLNDIDSNYDYITNKLNNIGQFRTEMLANVKYDFAGNHLMHQVYDEDGNLVPYTDYDEYGKKIEGSTQKRYNNLGPNVQDAALDDSSQMIFYENTTYIVSTIVLSVMIITFMTMAR